MGQKQQLLRYHPNSHFCAPLRYIHIDPDDNGQATRRTILCVFAFPSALRSPFISSLLLRFHPPKLSIRKDR